MARANNEALNDENAAQAQSDVIDTVLTVPVSKLDADQYSAEDLDGVTESLFGSGNMAYASLQASQTDQMIVANDPFGVDSMALPDMNTPEMFRGGGANTDRPVDIGGGFVPENTGGEGSYTNGTVGSLGASALSSDIGTFRPSSGFSISEGNFFRGANFNNNNAQSSRNAIDSNTNNNTQNTTNNSETVTNTTNVTNVDETVIHEGDTLIEGDTITEVIENVTNIFNEIISDLLGGDLGLNLDVNGILDTLGLGADIPLTDLLSTDLNLNVDLAPAVDLVDNIADLTGIEVLGDTLGQLDGVTGAVQGAVNQVTDLVTNLDLRNLDATIEQAFDILTNLGDTTATITQGVDDAVGGVLGTLGIGDGNDTLGNTVDSIFGDAGGNLDALTGGLTGDVTAMLGSVVDPLTNVLDDLTDNTLDEVGATVMAVVDGATDIVDDLAAGVEDLLTGEADLQDVVGDVLEETQEIVNDIIDGAGDAVGDLLGDLGLGGDDNTLSDVIDGVVGGAGDALDALTGGATGDLTNNLTNSLDPITDLVDDLTGGLGDILGAGGASDPQAIVEDVVDTVGDVVDDALGGLLGGIGDSDPDGNDGGLISQIVDPVIGGAGDVLDGLTGGATGDLTEGLEGATGDLTDTLDGLTDGLTGGDGSLLPDLGGGLGDLTGGLLDGGSGGGDTGGLLGGLFGGSGSSAPAENTAPSDDNGDPLTEDSSSEDALENILGDLDLGLSGNSGPDGETDNGEGDGDITLGTGLDLIDNSLVDVGLGSTLDGLETVSDDIDLGLGGALNILGNQADPIVDDGEGGNDEGGLPGDVSDDIGDLAGDLLDGDNSLAEIAEDIVNDVDLEDALGLLGDGGLLGGGGDASGDDEASWTETTIDDGGIFGDLLDGLGGGSDPLPDPVGTVAEGLGGLDLTPDVGSGGGGLLGGLFG